MPSCWLIPGMPPTHLDEFLRETGIDTDFESDVPLWHETGIRYARYAERRRRAKGGSQRRLLADFMIDVTRFSAPIGWLASMRRTSALTFPN